MTSSTVADLRARYHRRVIIKTSCRCRAACALRYVLVHLAIFIWARTKAFYRSHDHHWIKFLNTLPRKSHAIQSAWRKVLNQNVTLFHKAFKNFFTFLGFGIHSDRTLVMVQHREIQTVGIRDIAQLTTRCITFARFFYLNYIRTKLSQ